MKVFFYFKVKVTGLILFTLLGLKFMIKWMIFAKKLSILIVNYMFFIEYSLTIYTYECSNQTGHLQYNI